MDKKGAKGYWISTAKIINQELFDEYVEKVGPWLKENGGEVFAKDTDPRGKEKPSRKSVIPTRQGKPKKDSEHPNRIIQNSNRKMKIQTRQGQP